MCDIRYAARAIVGFVSMAKPKDLILKRTSHYVDTATLYVLMEVVKRGIQIGMKFQLLAEPLHLCMCPPVNITLTVMIWGVARNAHHGLDYPPFTMRIMVLHAAPDFGAGAHATCKLPM